MVSALSILSSMLEESAESASTVCAENDSVTLERSLTLESRLESASTVCAENDSVTAESSSTLLLTSAIRPLVAQRALSSITSALSSDVAALM